MRPHISVRGCVGPPVRRLISWSVNLLKKPSWVRSHLRINHDNDVYYHDNNVYYNDNKVIITVSFSSVNAALINHQENAKDKRIL